MIPRPTIQQLLDHLHDNPFFGDLDTETLQILVNGAIWREYAAGELVVLEGEISAGMYYLHSGWLKAVKVSPNGREQVLRFFEAGETFYELGAFAKQPHPATAVALEPAGIWLIRRETVLQLIRERPYFAEFVLAKMAERMLHLVSLVTDLSLRSITERLARLLLESAEEDRLYRPRWYTQAELAARLGTVPDVIQRALRELEQEGLIEVQRRVIHILDRQKLTQKIT
ncbi:MAG: Crp/Fnr family transcriptional regulator [Anaerolineales bacterium]|nr:Crp/Fnr family transcriptional regulator [Anaerolineales bacterium]